MVHRVTKNDNELLITCELLSWKTLRKFYLLNHSNCSHPSLEVVVHLFLPLKDGNHPFFEVYCAVFIDCTTAVARCHSLLIVVTRCITRRNSLPLVAPLVALFVIRCHSLYHSLSFVVTRCHSMYHSSVFL